jgi:L-rhamnose isomerase
LDVWGLAIPERPVLFLDFHQVDEDVLATKLEALVQSIHHRLIEGALLIDRSSLAQRQLNEDAVLGSRNTDMKSSAGCSVIT